MALGIPRYAWAAGQTGYGNVIAFFIHQRQGIREAQRKGEPMQLIQIAYLANLFILAPIAVPTIFRIFPVEQKRFPESPG